MGKATSIRWSSKLTFIFAAAAAAIGLGNIWRFPYMTGTNGGGAFVLIYLGFVIALGIPLLTAEVLLGRMGRKNPAASIADLAEQSNKTRLWGWLGGLTILAGYLILTYYVVIVGWVVDYLFRALLGEFANATLVSSLKDFRELQASHWEMLLTTSGVMLATMAILVLGIKRGLERAVMFMFPALLILMLVLLGYAMTTGSFGKGITYLFEPDFSRITAKIVLMALGQAFFSLNIAMGVTIMFSAYLPKKVSIPSSVVAITIADTGVALLAGLIIFPIVFANHLKPGAGPSLIFKILPLAFKHLPYGSVIAALFFLMLFFAAFSSVIAVIEPSIAWLIENCRMSRAKAVLISGGVCWLLSLGTIASFSYPKHLHIFGKSFFQIIDFVTAGIMLPIGGLLLAIFTGWLLYKRLIQQTVAWNTQSIWYRLWQVLLRYFTPIAILFILLTSFGII